MLMLIFIPVFFTELGIFRKRAMNDEENRLSHECCQRTVS